MDFRAVAGVLLAGGLLFAGCNGDKEAQAKGDGASANVATSQQPGPGQISDPFQAPPDGGGTKKDPIDLSKFATPGSPGVTGGMGGPPGFDQSSGRIPNPTDPDNPVEYREASDEEVRALVLSLGNPPDPVSKDPGQMAAVKELLAIGPKAAPMIMEGLEDPNPMIRQGAVFTLANMFHTEAVPKIVELLDKEPDHDTRITVAKALGVIRSPLAVEGLLRHVNVKDTHVRFFVLNSLGQQEDPKAIPALAEVAIEDGDAVMRRSAIYALGMIKDPEALPYLEKCLDDANDDIRMQAARGMGEIAGQETVPFLLKALHDTSATVRREAIYSLNSVGGDEVVQAIADRLEVEKKDFVIHMGLWSIGQLGDEKHIPLAKRWVASPDVKVRERALLTVHVLRGSPSYGEIRHELQSEDADDRLYAIWLLAREGTTDNTNIPDLEPLVEDESVVVRKAATDVLGVFRSRKAVPIFAKILDTETDLEVLRSALHFVQIYTTKKILYDEGALGTRSMEEIRMHFDPSEEQVVPRYIRFLMHDDVRLRQSAQRAIADCSGLDFEYSFDNDEDSRRASMEPIEAWWKAKSDVGPRAWVHARVQEAIEKLASTDPIEREIYSDALRSVTGQPFRATVESSPEDIEKTIAQWKEWWAAHGEKSRLEWLVDGVSDETRPLEDRMAIFTDIFWFYTGEHFGAGPSSPPERKRAAIQQFLEYWGENSERLLEEHASR